MALVVPYYPLSDAMLGQIVRLQLKRIQRRLEENHNIISEFDDSVVEQIVQRCTEVGSAFGTVRLLSLSVIFYSSLDDYYAAN